MDGSNVTMLAETFSDDDKDFRPDLPITTGISDQTTAVKDIAVEKENASTDDGKPEKKVPATPTTENIESVIVAKHHRKTKC